MSASSRCVLRALAATILATLPAGCANRNGQRQPPARVTVAPAPLGSRLAPAPDIFAMALEFASRGDMTGAVAALDRLPGWPERTTAIARLIDALAGTNFHSAELLAAAFPAGFGRDAAAEAVTRNLLARDEKAALAYALALPDREARGAAIRTLTTELVRRNPRGAIDSILALPASPARDEAARRAAGSWIRQGPADAIGWLRDLPDSEMKRTLTATMAFELAQQDPRTALSLVEALPAGLQRRAIWLAAAETWAALDPAAAAEWAKQLPDGEARELALQGLANAEGVDSFGVNRAPVARRR